jgi:hypothetical protein
MWMFFFLRRATTLADFEIDDHVELFLLEHAEDDESSRRLRNSGLKNFFADSLILLLMPSLSAWSCCMAMKPRLVCA